MTYYVTFYMYDKDFSGKYYKTPDIPAAQKLNFITDLFGNYADSYYQIYTKTPTHFMPTKITSFNGTRISDEHYKEVLNKYNIPLK